MLEQFPRCTLPRQQLITASEVAAIVGVSPWQTAHDVWVNKRNPKPQETAAMRRGTAAEDIIHGWFEAHGHDGNRPLSVEPGLRYGDAPIQGPLTWVGASPDALAVDADMNVYTVEYKTSSQPWFGGIPPHYLVQVRWQLLCVPTAAYGVLIGVTGLSVELDGMLASVDASAQTAGQTVLSLMLEHGAMVPQVYIVQRNPEEERALLRQVADWYAHHVVMDIEPELQAKDLAAVQRTWMALEAPNTIEVDDDIDGGKFSRLAADLAAADATAKEAEEAAKKARAELLSYWASNFGTAEVAVLPGGGKVSYKSQAGRASIDADRLRKEHPQLAAEYTTQGAPFRTLRFSKK